MFSYPITCSLSPNTEPDDVLLACRQLVAPWTWQHGDAVEQSEQWFKSYFGTSTAVSFNSGRSALLALLQAFHIAAGDEVLQQAFTCVAVPNSVRWAGATPVYVDIDETYNIDPRAIEKKITKKTKAIIVQHTFGIPANMDAIMPLVKKHKLILIEDCAHSLGATYKGKKVGTFGDGAFFSFGRDKVVSSVWGGMATINEQCTMNNVQLKLRDFQKSTPMPSVFWILQQLLHPIAFSFILSLYNVEIGKVLLFLLQKLRLLSFPVYPEEKRGDQPHDFPAKYPNALATLLLHQLKKLERYNRLRRKTADFYKNNLSPDSSLDSSSSRMRRSFLPQQFPEGSIFLRYPLLVPDPQKIIAQAKKQGILLGNWYQNIIDPKGVDFQKVGYTLGSCPKAEEKAKHIVNLPTRVSLHQSTHVVSFLQILKKYI